MNFLSCLLHDHLHVVPGILNNDTFHTHQLATAALFAEKYTPKSASPQNFYWFYI